MMVNDLTYSFFTWKLCEALLLFVFPFYLFIHLLLKPPCSFFLSFCPSITFLRLKLIHFFQSCARRRRRRGGGLGSASARKLFREKNSFYFREIKLVNIILNREKQIKATSLRPPKSQIKQQQMNHTNQICLSPYFFSKLKKLVWSF